MVGFFIEGFSHVAGIHFLANACPNLLPEGPAPWSTRWSEGPSPLELFEAARRFLEGVPIDINRIAQELLEVARANDIGSPCRTWACGAFRSREGPWFWR